MPSRPKNDTRAVARVSDVGYGAQGAADLTNRRCAAG